LPTNAATLPAPAYQAPIPASANAQINFPSAQPQVGLNTFNYIPPPAIQTASIRNDLPVSGYASTPPAIGTTAHQVVPPPLAPNSSGDGGGGGGSPPLTPEQQASAQWNTGSPNPQAPPGTLDWQLQHNIDIADSGGGGKRGGSVGKGIRGFDYGGAIGPGGVDPTTPMGANPQVSAQAQQYAQMSPEQLQQMAIVFGNTPQGQLISRILQQKRMMPNQSIGTAPKLSAPSPMINPAQMHNPSEYIEPPPAMRADGGRAPQHYESGGSVTGYLHGATGGRTDVLNISPPAGSYVIPADIVSGLGEGNSIAGAAVLNRAFVMGPWNTAMPAPHRGMGIPSAPPTYGVWQKEFKSALPTAAKGGKVEDKVGQPTPIIAASGEFIVDPEKVRAVGGGNITRGHNVLDAWVIKKRKQINEEQRKLKPPKK
jgi:hypothetical protein